MPARLDYAETLSLSPTCDAAHKPSRLRACELGAIVVEEAGEPQSSFLTTMAIAEIATRGLFGEALSQLELLELCTAVLCEIARLRREYLGAAAD